MWFVKGAAQKRWASWVGGIVLGAMLFWIIAKAVHPILRSICVQILEDPDKHGTRQGRIVNVEVEVLNLTPMTRHIVSVGETRANKFIKVCSEINGIIKKIHFIEGGSVQEGQALITLQDATLRAEYGVAKADFEIKEANFKRADKLYFAKSGSRKDLDTAKAELTVAKERLEKSLVELNKTVIKAPFSGTVGILITKTEGKTEGSYIQAKEEIVTLVDTSPIKVDFRIPEKHVHDVGVGQTVEVRVDASKDRVYYAIVQAVEPVVERESHSLLIKASLDNDDGTLKPGMFANVSLITGEKGDSLTVPEASVDREGAIEFVWVVEKGKASRKPILTGVKENGRVEVVSGLKAGMCIVTVGQIKLSDGTKVMITNLPQETDKTNKSLSEKNSHSPV